MHCPLARCEGLHLYSLASHTSAKALLRINCSDNNSLTSLEYGTDFVFSKLLTGLQWCCLIDRAVRRLIEDKQMA